MALYLAKSIGSKIIGLSDSVPTNPSLFESAKVHRLLSKDCRININNFEEVFNIVKCEKPDIIFHLAAQPIVSLSYSNPIDTIHTNAIGTANILECVRRIYTDQKVVCVMITSDKCYENVEWTWGYRENDKLGGKDVYSEQGVRRDHNFIISRSFFQSNKFIKLASARAGNVIGGGDFAKIELC